MAYTQHNHSSSMLLNSQHLPTMSYGNNFHGHFQPVERNFPLTTHHKPALYRPMPPPYKPEPMQDAGAGHPMLNHGQMLTPHQLSAPAVTMSPTHSPPMSNMHGVPHPNNDYHVHQLHHYSPPMEHTSPSNEQQYTIQPPSSMPSPTNSCPSSGSGHSNLRFEIVLEAPTAAAQRAEESPLTYLNKGMSHANHVTSLQNTCSCPRLFYHTGQHYAINLKDHDGYDGDITSTVKIAFHDETHRKGAQNFWKFWLSQQQPSKTARAIDIEAHRGFVFAPTDADKSTSTGVKNIDSKSFDKISFQWNGKKGAKIYIKFNCLSTDFSRIKGVKGIPLRAYMESRVDGHPESLEKAYCKIKLFRDKGAERKNKDDAKHLEKQLEKMRGKNGESHPLWLMYAQAHPVTVFAETPGGVGTCSDEDDNLHLSDGLASLESEPEVENNNPNLSLIPSSLTMNGKRSRKFDQYGEDYLDLDPNYVPQARKRKAVLCLYIRFSNEQAFRAVYLERLTTADLTVKLCEKLELQPSSIVSVERVNIKRNLTVCVDDAVVMAMDEEQDMEVSYEMHQDATVSLILRY
ncbi:CP2 transcription factor-domain-containing protein [Jimgerdemannia flammicorona]|uniref:CP2 transcription factor-domain-containing protein n=1 Tax=Jimgerdemannia flammicorona TaxID=994334 RepID=A0A433CZE5_9FUNG|nr:CP2 transcription factor-domain-containing protein [Jimgerdemannia flammicorona]